MSLPTELSADELINLRLAAVAVIEARRTPSRAVFNGLYEAYEELATPATIIKLLDRIQLLESMAT